MTCTSPGKRELAAAERTASTLIKVLDAHLHASVEKSVSACSSSSIASSPRSFPASRERSSSRNCARAGLFPEASSFRVTDAAGNYIYDATGELSAANIADRDYFRRHQAQRDSGLVVSEPIKSRVSGRWVIVLSRRLEDGQGNLRESCSRPSTPATSRNFMPRSGSAKRPARPVESGFPTDRPVAAPRRVAGQDAAGRHAQQRHRSRQAFRHPGHQGHAGRHRARLITFKVADRLPLVLVVGQAESEILAEWHHRALTYAVLCVQLGAALIALAFYGHAVTGGPRRWPGT